MKKQSIFATAGKFFSDTVSVVRAAFRGASAALPYVFGIGEDRKEVTEQYPDPISAKMPEDLPPRARGLLFNDIERCTGCKECQVVCPTKCISVATEDGPDHGKLWVSLFSVDFSKCVFCGLCAEVCEPVSLVHTKQYEGAVYSKSDMIANFGRGYVTPEQRAKWIALREQRESEVTL